MRAVVNLVGSQCLNVFHCRTAASCWNLISILARSSGKVFAQSKKICGAVYLINDHEYNRSWRVATVISQSLLILEEFLIKTRRFCEAHHRCLQALLRYSFWYISHSSVCDSMASPKLFPSVSILPVSAYGGQSGARLRVTFDFLVGTWQQQWIPVQV